MDMGDYGFGYKEYIRNSVVGVTCIQMLCLIKVK